MKRKFINTVAAVIVVILLSAVWYLSPTTFLNGVDPSEVKSISVFDGNTGNGFNITDLDEIQYIVENIQGMTMEKGKVSIGHIGYRFRMSFYDNAGNEIANFILNSADTIRKDPFFYRCDGNLCFDYLKELEGKYAN